MAIPVYRLRSVIQALGDDLDAVEAKAVGVSTSVRSARSAVDETRNGLVALSEEAADAVLAVSSSSSQARAAAESNFGGIAASTQSALEAVDGAASAIATSGSRAQEAARETTETIHETTREIQERTTQLDRMKERFTDFAREGNAQVQSLIDRLDGQESRWAAIIQQMLQEVEAGARKVQDLLKYFGDAEIAVENGTEKLRDLLDDLNPQQYIQELIDLQKELRNGTKSIEDVVAVLKAKNFEVARSFGELIERVRQGKATLEDLRRRVEQLQELYPDSALAELADALADELQQAEREGYV